MFDPSSFTNPLSRNGQDAMAYGAGETNPIYSGSRPDASIINTGNPLLDMFGGPLAKGTFSAFGIDANRIPQRAAQGESSFTRAAQANNASLSGAGASALWGASQTGKAFGEFGKNSFAQQFALPQASSGGSVTQSAEVASALLPPISYVDKTDGSAAGIAGARYQKGSNIALGLDNAVSENGNWYKNRISNGQDRGNTIKSMAVMSKEFGGVAEETLNTLSNGGKIDGKKKEQVQKGIKETTDAVNSMLELFGPNASIAESAKAIKNMTDGAKLSMTDIKKISRQMQATAVATGVSNDSMIKMTTVASKMDESMGGANRGKSIENASYAMQAGAAAERKGREEAAKRGEEYTGGSAAEIGIETLKTTSNTQNSDDAKRARAQYTAAAKSKNFSKAQQEEMAQAALDGDSDRVNEIFSSGADAKTKSDFGHILDRGAEMNVAGIEKKSGRKADIGKQQENLIKNVSKAYANMSAGPDENGEYKEDKALTSKVEKGISMLDESDDASTSYDKLVAAGVSEDKASEISTEVYAKGNESLRASVINANKVISAKSSGELGRTQNTVANVEKEMEIESNGKYARSDQTTAESLITAGVESMAEMDKQGKKGFGEYYDILKKNAKTALNPQDKVKFQAAYEKEKYGDKISKATEDRIAAAKEGGKDDAYAKAQKELGDASVVDEKTGERKAKSNSEADRKRFTEALVSAEKEKTKIANEEFSKLTPEEQKDAGLTKKALEAREKGISKFETSAEERRYNTNGQKELNKAVGDSVSVSMDEEQKKAGEAGSPGVSVDASTSMPQVGDSPGMVEGGADAVLKAILAVIQAIFTAIEKLFPGSTGGTLDQTGP